MRGTRAKALRRAAYGDKPTKSMYRTYSTAKGFVVCIDPEYRAYKAAKQAWRRQR